LGNPYDYNSSEYPEYTYANFIDAEVIKYYDARFENLKGKPMDMGFNYNADVFFWDRIHVVYVPASENESMYAAKIQFLSSNGTILNVYGGFDRCAYGNNSGIQEIQASAIDFEFSSCYVVEMELTYSETYAPVAAFFSHVRQTVVVDENFKPLLLCVQPQKMIS
jgi:hypothetical protein